MKNQPVRKSIYKSILASLLLLALTLTPIAGSLAAEYSTVINPLSNKSVNLRDGVEGNVIASYPAGTPVEILSHGTWMYVKIQGRTGYMHADFINLRNITTTPQGTKDEYLYVNTANKGNLNLRVQPSHDSDVIASYAPGTRVKVLSKGQTWYKVEVNGAIGYMVKQYLSTSKPSGSTGGSSSKTINSYAVVNNPKATQVLNLRATPSLTAKVLGQYRNGTKLFVYSKTGEWYKVSVGANVGYMMSQYVKLTGSSSDARFKTVINNNGGSYVNLRCNAGMHYEVLKRVNVGTTVEVLEKGEFWTRVNAGGTIGYMNNYFLK